MRILPITLTGLVALASCGCTTEHAAVRPTPVDAGAAPDAAWSWLDIDGNGQISIAELRDRHAVGLLQDRRHADTNADARINRAEWDAWWPELDISPPAPAMARLNQRAPGY